MADLVQADVFEASAQVALHGGGERGEHITTQVRAVAGQRVGDLDAHRLDDRRIIGERLEVLIADERVAQRLDHAVFGKRVCDPALATLVGVSPTAPLTGAGGTVTGISS